MSEIIKMRANTEFKICPSCEMEYTSKEEVETLENCPRCGDKLSLCSDSIKAVCADCGKLLSDNNQVIVEVICDDDNTSKFYCEDCYQNRN